MKNPHRPENVVIPRKEYERLQRRDDMLSGLEGGGVDNWQWYSDSLKDYHRKYYPEDFE